MLTHPISPVFNKDSKILILGSFPSAKSREIGFFYGHPQNRFWQVLARVLKKDEPVTIKEKKCFLINNNIAVWDVIASCDIVGSSDSSIKNVFANDLHIILDNTNIRKIFVNGKTAAKYYNRYIKDNLGIEAICLPSTSPANAAWTIEKLVAAWQIIATD